VTHTPDILLTRDGGVVRIELNRPHRHNAITVKMMRAMTEAIKAAGRDSDARVIVITGAGEKAFCSGADLTPDDTPFKPDFAKTTLPFADLLRAGKASRVPIVAAVNGTCIAGGMGLVGMADIAIASASARFGMPEAKIGIFPMQIVAVLRDLLSPRVMADLCYTGRLIDARTAFEYGLVNRVVEAEGLAEAVNSYVEELLAVSPVAVRRGRYALRAMASMSFEEMIAFAETQVGPMVMTDDAREGMRAFNEKRKPIWPNS